MLSTKLWIDGWCSIAKSCLTPWDLMGCYTPGFPVLCYLPEFAQVHVPWVGMLSDYLILCQSLVQAKNIDVIHGTLLSFTPQTNQQSLLALPSHYLKSEYFSPLSMPLTFFWVPSVSRTAEQQRKGPEKGQGISSPLSLCFRLASLALALSPHSRGASSMAPWLLGSPLTLLIPFFATSALGIILPCLFCLASLSMLLQIAPSPVSSCEWDFLLSWLQPTGIHFTIMTCIYINGDISFDPFISEKKYSCLTLEVPWEHYEALGCLGLSYNHWIHSYWKLLCGIYYAGPWDAGMINSVLALREFWIWWGKWNQLGKGIGELEGTTRSTLSRHSV